MSLFQSNKHQNNYFDFAGICKVKIDEEKTKIYKENLYFGIENYSLFQKYSSFKWPAWLNYSANKKGENVNTFIPLVLINNSMRDVLSFTNFLSDEEILIDSSGMISPSYDRWSIEIWVAINNSIYRSSEDIENVSQKRDSETSLIHTVWDNMYFKLNQTIYGARSNIDEAIIEIDCNVKEKTRYTSLLLVIRPYNNQRLGGVNNIKYKMGENFLIINGYKCIHIKNEPDFVLGGDGKKGDIDIKDKEDSFESACQFGMASIGLGYKLKKGNNILCFRISLNNREEIVGGKIDYNQIREDYISYAAIRIKNNVNLHIPDKLIRNWFYASKISVLNFMNKDLYLYSNGENVDSIDYKSIYYIVHGYNRMGYFKESIELIDFLLKYYKPDEKDVLFHDIINGCYLLAAFTDYYVHVRDVEYIQSKYNYIKRIAYLIYKKSTAIKNQNNFNKNSLPEYIVQEGHSFDLILLSYALSQFSYLARSLGIFGDEIKFDKESKRISVYLKNYFADITSENAEYFNEFFYYNSFAGFPFKLTGLTDDDFKKIIDKIFKYFNDLPLFIKSMGCDILSSLVVINNLIFLKDERGYQALDKLLNISRNRYLLPDFMHPVTNRSVWGNGTSKVISAVVFSTIRNLLFIDTTDRLDIFPVPNPAWFEPGHEIAIEDLPSRFGLINIRLVATANEIQFHFDKLPKYVPPDIMLNLPVKVKICKEDDFIVKKEDGKSFIINGWPSIVRFIRK